MWDYPQISSCHEVQKSTRYKSFSAACAFVPRGTKRSVDNPTLPQGLTIIFSRILRPAGCSISNLSPEIAWEIALISLEIWDLRYKTSRGTRSYSQHQSENRTSYDCPMEEVALFACRIQVKIEQNNASSMSNRGGEE